MWPIKEKENGQILSPLASWKNVTVLLLKSIPLVGSGLAQCMQISNVFPSSFQYSSTFSTSTLYLFWVP